MSVLAQTLHVARECFVFGSTAYHVAGGSTALLASIYCIARTPWLHRGRKADIASWLGASGALIGMMLGPYWIPCAVSAYLGVRSQSVQ